MNDKLVPSGFFDPRWKSSIAFILRQHRGYVEQDHFICGNF